MNKELQKILSMFHDGTIEDIKQEFDNDYMIKVDIEYLAELINNEYSYFFLKVKDVESVYLKLYQENSDEEVTDVLNINNYEFTILSCKFENDSFMLMGDAFDTISEKEYYSELYLKCGGDYELYSENMEQVGFNLLSDIVKQYWNK